MWRILVVAVCLTGTCCAAAPLHGDEPAAAKTAAPMYAKDVHRFFKNYCLACHSDEEAESGLSLQSFQTLQKGGDSGEKLIVPGKPQESRLILLLTGKAEPKMPPEDEKQPEPEEIALLARWIKLGAKGPTAGDAKASGYDLPDVPKVLPKTPVNAAIVSIAVSPDGKILAAARHREVVLINAADGKVIRKLPGAKHPLNAVAFSPDGQHIAAAGGPAGIGGTVRIWNTDGKSIGVIEGHDDSIYGLAFSPIGKMIATSSYDKLIKLWDVAGGNELRTLKHHTAAVFDVAFSPDGKTLASAGDDQTVKLWDVASGKRIVTLSEPTGGVNAVAFHPQGTELAAVGVDKTLRVWSFSGKSAAIRKSLFAHDASILDVTYAPDGKSLYTASEDGRIKAWDTAQLRERHVYENLSDWPHALAVAPGGGRLFAGQYDGFLLGFDAAKSAAGDVLIAGRRPEPIKAENKVAKKIPPRPRAPELSSISPRTAVRGSTVKLTLSGRNIADADQLFIAPDSIKGKLLPHDGKSANKIQCEIELPADLPPRMIALRLHTPTGSTGAKSFYVGPFAEHGEKEPNDAVEQATAAELPKTLVGTINRKGDRDLWSFPAGAGDEIVFQLIGAGLGSALNADTAILDANGRILVRSERHPTRRDVVIGHRFAEAGTYYLRVEDNRFSGGGRHFYYIHAGPFAYVDRVFPLGVTAGTDGPSAHGYRLGDAAKIVPPKDATGTLSKRLNTASGPTLNEARYTVSKFPEMVETEPNDSPNQAAMLPVPGAMNGYISTGDTHKLPDDFVAFEAKKGQRLLIEVTGRRQGSPLDSVIEILDSAGKPVGRRTLRAISQTFITLRDHGSKRTGIRLQNWDNFQINDYLMLGGEVVKIRSLPLGPDEDVKFFSIGARLGYFGTTPQGHAVNSTVYQVEVHPPGRTFPPNGMPVVALTYRNDDGGPGLGSDSRLVFEPPADGKYLVRISDVRGLAGNDFFYRLMIRPPRPDFRIGMSPADPNIPRGGNLPVTISATRLEGFEGSIDVRIEGLPEGVTATTGRIGPDDTSCVVTFSAAADCEIPVGKSMTVKAVGRAGVEERAVEHSTATSFGLHQLTLAPAPTLEVDVTPPKAEILPGEELRFQLKLKRNYGFTSRVPIKIDNLPHGVRVLHVGLNGVLIPEGQTEQSFVIKCEPWAERRPVSFFATARVEATGELNSSAPVLLKIGPSSDQLADGN